MAPAPTVPVFDIGGVLIDWNPRHLYAKLFDDDHAMERFLTEVCSPAWNLEQDRGRPWDEAVALLVERHPDQADLIRAYDTRWDEMVSGAFDDTVALLERARARGPVHAITNFSEAKFRRACARFPFLTGFDVCVVSGIEGLVKPDPAIYHRLLERTGLPPEACLFIDDAAHNVEGARAVGMHAVRFESAARLERDMAAHGLI
jgi:2-haloacid dehalogenase